MRSKEAVRTCLVEGGLVACETVWAEVAASAALRGLLDDVVEVIRGGSHRPLLAGALAHVAVAAIHPSNDGNGRVARLLHCLAVSRGTGLLARPGID